MQAKRLWVIGLVIFILLGCQSEWKSENEEVAYWNAALVDTCFKVLYQDKYPDRALVDPTFTHLCFETYAFLPESLI